MYTHTLFIASLRFSTNFSLPGTFLFFPTASLKTDSHFARAISMLTTFLSVSSSPGTQGRHALPPQSYQLTPPACLLPPIHKVTSKQRRFIPLNCPSLRASNFYLINEQYTYKFNAMLHCIHSYGTTPNPPTPLFSLNLLMQFFTGFQTC